jgi:hypothetical protein
MDGVRSVGSGLLTCDLGAVRLGFRCERSSGVWCELWCVAYSLQIFVLHPVSET